MENSHLTPISGCSDHLKCRLITHPSLGQKVVFDHPSNGTATGTVLEVLPPTGPFSFPRVIVQSHGTGYRHEFGVTWINWKGDPWNTMQVME